MTSALDGLDAIAWAGMRVDNPAFCDSARIPDDLRRLAAAAGNRAAWEAAMDVRSGYLHEHSGCYLQATEFVVPFLVRLCGTAGPWAALWSAELLTEVALGEPFVVEREAGNAGLAERTRAALLAGLPVYRRLLESPEPRVARTAAELLAGVEEWAGPVL